MNKTLHSLCKLKGGRCVERTVDGEDGSVLNGKDLIIVVLVGRFDGCNGWIVTRGTRSLGTVLVIGVDARLSVHNGQLVWFVLVFLGTDFTVFTDGNVFDFLVHATLVASKDLEGTELVSSHKRNGTGGVNVTVRAIAKVKLRVGIKGTVNREDRSMGSSKDLLDVVLVDNGEGGGSRISTFHTRALARVLIHGVHTIDIVLNGELVRPVLVLLRTDFAMLTRSLSCSRLGRRRDVNVTIIALE